MSRRMRLSETEDGTGPSPDGRRCSTCAKRFKRGGKNRGCRVLAEQIGLTRDCFAWTDDEKWQEKIQRALIAYRDSPWWRKHLSRLRKREREARER